MQMKVHTTAMEAPLYQSYQVYIVNKMRAKIEIHLGISGDKIEIDPVQQKNSKFILVRQKAVSHHMDSVAWCEVTEVKSGRTTFKIVYTPSFSTSNNSNNELNNSGKTEYHNMSLDRYLHPIMI